MTDQETAPIEVTTRYATTVASLADAFAFVMDRIDHVGDSPQVDISPVWTISYDSPDEPSARRFSVVVSGMVEEDK
jgi:hypothetical protein